VLDESLLQNNPVTEIDPTLGVVQAFDDLQDPRKQAGRFQYPLQELLLTALCAVSAGAEDWVDVAEWGEFKLPWLRRFLPFERAWPRTTPSAACSRCWMRVALKRAFGAGWLRCAQA
jgi:hypothetical protein